MKTPEPYTYYAICIDVHDGDTVTLNVDLGMSVTMREQRIRLEGVMAPELREQHGPEAAQYLRGLLHAAKVLVSTKKEKQDKDRREKYGRWLGTIYRVDAGQLINVNEEMNRWLEERCKT